MRVSRAKLKLLVNTPTHNQPGFAPVAGGNFHANLFSREG
jgi:hypothetical protein